MTRLGAMGLVRRLPVYATGIGFTLGIIAIADARRWSGLVIVFTAFGVGVFYVVAILVPWLVWAKAIERHEPQRRLFSVQKGDLRWRSYALQPSDPVRAVFSLSNVGKGQRQVLLFRVELRGPDGKLVALIDEKGTVLAQEKSSGPETIPYSEPRVAVG